MSAPFAKFSPRLAFWILPLAAVLFLAGCASLSNSGVISQLDQTQRTTSYSLAPGGKLGQTFTARFDGLQTVSVHLPSHLLDQGQLALRLYGIPADLPPLGSPAAGQPLASAVVDLSAASQPGYVPFTFTPLRASSNIDYYLEIELAAPDGSELEISTGPADSYLDGALYLNERPENAQLAFHLSYDRTRAALGYALALANGLGWIGLGLLLVLLPGWALMDLLPTGLQPVDFTVRLGLAAGAGFALYPLLLQWSWVVGWKPGALLAWIPTTAAAIYLLLRRKSLHLRVDLPGGLALILLLLVAVARAAAVLGLPAPMWGDSYQHSVITQLLLDHGGLFQSWEPYTELPAFTYHFGFHSFAAVLSWISGLPAPQAVLWAGQAAGVLAVLALVPLADRLGRTAWAAPAVLLLVGLLSPMPAFYTNWGRYTQLAGQVILPAFLWLCMALLARSEEKDHPLPGWRLSLLLALVSAGLALTHVRILILAALYPITHSLLSLHQPNRLRRYGWLAAAGLTGIILYLPWFTNSTGSQLSSMFVQQISTPLNQVRQAVGEVNLAGSLKEYLPIWLWLLLLLSSGWAAWRRRDLFIPLLGWLVLAVLVANPQWLALPGSGIIGAYTTFIAAYIPLGIVGGAWLGSLVHWLESGWSNQPGRRLVVLRAVLVIAALAAAGLGLLARIDDVRPTQFALVTHPDLRAAAWLRTNLPQQAHLLVNAFPAFYDTSIVGADAGWWLPLLAGRTTTLPPLNYAIEDEPYPGYRQTVNQLVEVIQGSGLDIPAVQQELTRRGITHLFIGQRQGALNNPYPPLLDPAALANSSHYRLLYRQDRIWIFEVVE